VLPGDVNDDGVVNSTDGVQILRSFTPANPYNIFDDLNGDGAVNMADFDLYRPQIGTVLPPMATASVVGIEGIAGGGSLAAPTSTGPAPTFTAAIGTRAVAAGVTMPQTSAVLVDAVLGASNEEALEPLPVPSLVKEIQAKTKRRASSKHLKHNGHRDEGAQRGRFVVTYHPGSSSADSERIKDTFLLDLLNAKVRT
jgi:hypothetical protein